MIKNILNKIQNLIGNSLLLLIIEKITGTKIFKKLPRGIDPLLDIKSSIPNYSFQTIIDVGANIGQSENYFTKKNPKSIVYCIEPIQKTFSILKKKN